MWQGHVRLRNGVTCLPLLVLLSWSGGVSAGESPAEGAREVPELRVSRANPHAPVVDGRLDDAAWNGPGLDFAECFTQREPDDGAAATESTRVAVIYDDDAVYFAFWCYDSEPDKVTRQLVRRDRGAESDAVAVRLDPYHDHQSGYEFQVNAAGVQCDARLFDDNYLESAWDAVWSSAVELQPWGWSAELRVPFYCLRFADEEEHVWGVDFLRSVNRKTESVRWAHTPVSEGGFVSNFGHLCGISGIGSPRRLEVLPHVVSSLEAEPRSAGNPDGRSYMRNAGFDLKYGLSSNLTLDATINPDFGQVELDRPVLNLSTYETYYPERRPFFMEGAELYHSEYTLFYSRRIGRPPQRDVEDDALAYYTHYPKATTILGAAKLTGKLSTGTSIAFLSAVTERETARYAAQIAALDSTWVGDSLSVDTASVDTVFREGVVEPGAFYSVLRLKQDILSNSSVGSMFTLASHNSEHPAVTGAVDWRLCTPGNAWALRGQSILSRVEGEHTGFATDVVVERTAGRHVRGSVGLVTKDRYFDINDLGYTQRNDYHEGWAWLQYRTTDDWWVLRNSYNNLNFSKAWNSDGANVDRSWNFNNTMQFVNNWYGWMGFSQSFGEYDDRETRGHGLWESPGSWHSWFCLDTDERKKWSFEFDLFVGESRTSPWWGGEALVRYRPAGNMEFWVHGEYTHDFGQLMWVENPDDTTSIFADKDQNIFNLDASASIVFHPNLSCQLSAQGLLTGLDYRKYRPYLGGGRYGPCQTGFDHDYHYTVLNSTFLLRWEYRPGSTIYLVWSRARSEVDETLNNLSLRRDFDRFFSGDADNVFLIKVSYWLNV